MEAGDRPVPQTVRLPPSARPRYTQQEVRQVCIQSRHLHDASPPQPALRQFTYTCNRKQRFSASDWDLRTTSCELARPMSHLNNWSCSYDLS
jgi:hypothetical protein